MADISVVPGGVTDTPRDLSITPGVSVLAPMERRLSSPPPVATESSAHPDYVGIPAPITSTATRRTVEKRQTDENYKELLDNASQMSTIERVGRGIANRAQDRWAGLMRTMLATGQAIAGPDGDINLSTG